MDNADVRTRPDKPMHRASERPASSEYRRRGKVRLDDIHKGKNEINISSEERRTMKYVLDPTDFAQGELESSQIANIAKGKRRFHGKASSR